MKPILVKKIKPEQQIVYFLVLTKEESRYKIRRAKMTIFLLFSPRLVILNFAHEL